MGRYAIFNGLVYGGGTNVIPNPEGTPTDELHSIQIDEDIYEIVGGGGGGGNASLEATVLYDTPITANGTYTLADSYENYDFISIKAGNGSSESDIHTYAVDDLKRAMSDSKVITNPNTGGWFNFTISTNELTIPNKTVHTIYSVIGYKIVGGGGGGSQELISYDTTITTTQYGWWTAEDKDGNTLDPDQYELIAVTPLVNNSSSWVGAWDGAFYVNSVDGTTHRYDVTFVNINDGGYIRTSRTWDIKVIYRDKNAAGGGGGSTVVPNPQEEPTDTLNTVEIDGVVYGIEGGSEGEGVEIYSEDEYIVGKWIDGKKLYQKTIYYTHNDTIGDGYTTIASLSDADYFEFVECSLYNPTDKRSYALSYAYGSKTTALTYDNGDIKLRVNSDTWNANWDVVITVRYTKTVETPAPAWGGSVNNYYANFIDTDNVIDSGVYNPTIPLSYTASEDCFVVIVLIANNNPCIVSVDNKEIYRIYDNGVGSITVPVPIKKGQTITATTSYSAEDSPYTVYGITYASGGSESGSSKIEYSTNEHVVGTWIDGRDVYEKTIYYASLQGRGSFLIDNTLTSTDVDFFAAQDVSYIVNNNYISGIGINLEVCANTQGVFLDNNNAPSGYPTNFTDIYVTIRYVKKVVS